MKKIVMTTMVCFAIGCGTDVDMGVRYLAEIQVIDSQGNPVPDAYLEIEAKGAGHHVGEGKIAGDRSDHDGNTFMLFAPPSNPRNYLEVAVYGSYPWTNTPVATPYESSVITNLEREQCSDYQVPITQMVLYRTDELTDLKLLVPESDALTIEEMTIDGQVSNPVFFSPVDLDFARMLRVVRNQTVTIHYVLNDRAAGTRTQRSETIAIANESVTVELGL